MFASIYAHISISKQINMLRCDIRHLEPNGSQCDSKIATLSISVILKIVMLIVIMLTRESLLKGQGWRAINLLIKIARFVKQKKIHCQY